MSKPTTEAGRRLLPDEPSERWHVARCPAIQAPVDVCTCRGALRAAIVAIESEASVEGFRQGLEHAKATYVPDARADLARRIEARVTALVRVGVGAAEPTLVPLAAVLAAIREEAAK